MEDYVAPFRSLEFMLASAISTAAQASSDTDIRNCLTPDGIIHRRTPPSYDFVHMRASYTTIRTMSDTPSVSPTPVLTKRGHVLDGGLNVAGQG